MTMISWVGITRWKCHIGFETINNISFSVSLPLFVPQHMQTHSIFRDRDRFIDTRTNRDTETETNTDTQRIYSRTRHTCSNQHHTRKRTNACCTTKVERTERRAVGNALPRQNYTALGAHVTVYLPTKTHQCKYGAPQIVLCTTNTSCSTCMQPASWPAPRRPPALTHPVIIACNPTPQLSPFVRFWTSHSHTRTNMHPPPPS